MSFEFVDAPPAARTGYRKPLPADLLEAVEGARDKGTWVKLPPFVSEKAAVSARAKIKRWASDEALTTETRIVKPTDDASTSGGYELYFRFTA